MKGSVMVPLTTAVVYDKMKENKIHLHDASGKAKRTRDYWDANQYVSTGFFIPVVRMNGGDAHCC